MENKKIENQSVNPTPKKKKSKKPVIAIIAIVLCLGVAGALGVFSMNIMKKNDALSSKLNEKVQDSVYAESVLADIEANIQAIRASRGMIQENFSVEDSGMSRDQKILAEIQNIEMLMAQNQHLIDTLETQLSDKDGELSKYKNTVYALNKKLRRYKNESSGLLATIDSLKIQIDTLTSLNLALNVALEESETQVALQRDTMNMQQEVIQEQTHELQSAFYVVGTYKDLKDGNVVEKKGGIAGIAAAKALKSNFNQEAFKQIDLTEVTDIPIFAKDVEIITSHDSKSYEILTDASGEVEWLKINDPKEFWKNSKYLVAITNKPSNK